MEHLKQPKSLYLLFFTELWERFGFYAVQTILVLYMSHGLNFSDQKSYLLFGTYSSMLYITPVIGGYIADRWLGFQRCIILGCILLGVGYLVASLKNLELFFMGLTLIILGNGFLKPNISSIVGDLYQPDDPRREGGFTIFYMGINIGALIPPLFVGGLVNYYGWHWGFLVAALGMVIAISIFLGFRTKYLPHDTQKPSAFFYPLLLLGLIGSFGFFYFIFHFPRLTGLILVIASFSILMVIVYHILMEKARDQRLRLIACVILIIVSMGFWAVYNQTFSSLMLFADRNMVLHFLGIPINAEMTQFFNPFFIIAFSPLFNRLWIYLEEKNLNPSIPMKFHLSLVFLAMGFFLLAIGDKYFAVNGLLSSGWLAASYALQTIGELLISPIGLSMITVLSPKRMVGMMMGIWFFALATAYALSGGLATIADVPSQASPIVALEIYGHALWIYGLIALCLALLTLILVPFLKKMIGN